MSRLKHYSIQYTNSISDEMNRLLFRATVSEWSIYFLISSASPKDLIKIKKKYLTLSYCGVYRQIREVVVFGGFKERDCNGGKRYRVLPPLPTPRSALRSSYVGGDVTRLHFVRL
jgi:hypothetical protein